MANPTGEKPSFDLLTSLLSAVLSFDLWPGSSFQYELPSSASVLSGSLILVLVCDRVGGLVCVRVGGRVCIRVGGRVWVGLLECCDL